MQPIVIYTTFPNLQDGRSITDTLVLEGLVACVNFLPLIHSTFMWEGQLTHSEEAAALLKTSSQQELQVIQRLAQLHPYSTPCIISLTVNNGFMPYLSWVLSNSAGK